MMKRLLALLTALFIVAVVAATASAARRPATWAPPSASSPAIAVATPVDDDPDMPRAITGDMDKATYMKLREDYFQLRFSDATFDQVYQGRLNAIQQLQRQAGRQGPFTSFSTWTAIGPFPIPNGQTTTIPTAVSGRVTAIAVHPTNPNLVYVGTAQGGVWRSSNGGTSWTAIFDGAASLAIGALTLAPTNPSILYVGTGEANLSGDSFFGVGLYRIDNADTAPILNGPFNPTPTTDIIGAKTFTGRSISQILVDPSDPATIFCSTASGIGGLGGEAFGSSPPITALRGIYRSTNATSGSPSFTKLTVTASSSIAPDVSGNLIVSDMAYDPTDASSNTIVCWVFGTTAALNGGIYRTINAKAATPAFAQTFVTTLSNARGLFAANRVAGVTTIYVATGETGPTSPCTGNGGVVRRSLDGGATWSAKLAGGNGFCGGQCFYDLPIAVSPVDANLVLVGGAGNGTCARVFARSTNGAATFTGAGVADVGLHADAHAIAFAPSDPSVVYEGNDGGIYRSADGGATWTSANTAGFSATQFQSVDVHPIDANFSIGGTQDNGTNWYQPATTWTRADFGDGGNAVIDQNAPDNTNVRMYHTYFNQRNNVVAYATVSTTASASDGNWSVVGQGSNDIALAENPNFYAPLVRGPGNPNTVYYATDRLHRSSDNGLTNPVVSQAPIAVSGTLGVPISAVAIAPSNDNVRLVGLNNFTIWGTVTGSSVLTNMTGAGMPTTKFIGRIAIDPTDPNVAYVCFGGFNVPAGQHVWRTSNLMSGTPTWLAWGAGLPDVPVNAFVIDPLLTSRLWAGTDVGVYQSSDGGVTWSPFTTGMPVVAVFDMKLQSSSRILRIATHGRGMWERFVDAPVATQLALVGAEIVEGHPRMTWYSADGMNQQMNLYRRAVPGDWAFVTALTADGTGMLSYEDQATQPGRSYEYRVGVMNGTTERMLGQVWVDVPSEASFALKALASNTHRGSLVFSVSLPAAGPATLDLMDVTGRRVASQEVGALGVGDHQVRLDTANAKSGMYWARLTQAGKMISTRVAMVY